MRFLVVDDDRGWLNHHAMVIGQIFPDAEIVLKNSAINAYQELLSQRDDYFDVILTDMQMEHVDDELFAGVWLLKQLFLMDKASKAKIIIISGVYNIKTIADEFGVDYIPKSSLIRSPLVFEYKLKEL